MSNIISSIDWVANLRALVSPGDWNEFEGPESGVGVDYWFETGCGIAVAYINLDQGHATISVTESGEERQVFSGEVADLPVPPRA